MLLESQKSQKGISLVTTIIVVSLLTTFSVVTISLVISNNKISANHFESTQAFWLAESGLERGLYWLRNQDPPPTGIAPFTQYDGVVAGNGTYTVVIDPDDQNDNTYLKRFLIRSTGTISTISRQLEVLVSMNTFNKYIYATGDEGAGTIWFTTGDMISGPMHSNDQIAISGSPVFSGRVTSSASSFLEGSGYNPTFAEGYQLNAPQVIFPTGSEIMDNYNSMNSGPPPLIIDSSGNKHAEIVFNADATITYDVYHWTGPWWNRHKVYDVSSTTVSLSGLNGMIKVEGDAYIEGTVDGNITLYATDDIYITDDIKYLDSGTNGQPNSGCDDMLGIISESDVIVAYTTPNLNDVIIDGAILALGNSFTVEAYYWGSPRGYIHLWGGLAQKIRGPVGASGYGGGTGYYKDYNYDDRFFNAHPPYFPTTGGYEISAWREVVN